MNKMANEQSERRTLEFNCIRVYDLRRLTGNPSTDSYVVSYHLQKRIDTHTLCGYKTDTWKKTGKWINASEHLFVDSPTERDSICFRCLRLWAIKNQLQYPRLWMTGRIENEEYRNEHSGFRVKKRK